MEHLLAQWQAQIKDHLHRVQKNKIKEFRKFMKTQCTHLE